MVMPSTSSPEIRIAHPYFERVIREKKGYRVMLCDQFPIRSFFMLPDKHLFDGYVEMTADIGFAHEDGTVDWIRGAGRNEREAVEGACSMFLNLVFSPEGLSETNFVHKSPAA